MQSGHGKRGQVPTSRCRVKEQAPGPVTWANPPTSRLTCEDASRQLPSFPVISRPRVSHTNDPSRAIRLPPTSRRPAGPTGASSRAPPRSRRTSLAATAASRMPGTRTQSLKQRQGPAARIGPAWLHRLEPMQPSCVRKPKEWTSRPGTSGRARPGTSVPTLR